MRIPLLPDKLYKKLAAVLALTTMLLAVLLHLMLVRLFWQGADEAEQLHHWNLAKAFAGQLEPSLRSGIRGEAVDIKLYELLELNPRVEIHLADAKGRMLLSAEQYKRIVWQDKIELGRTPEELRLDLPRALLHEMLQIQANRVLPVLGPSPFQRPESRQPISVARIRIGGKPGYLYLVLRSETFQRVEEITKDYYLMFGSVLSTALVVLLTTAVGSLLFFLMTRRLGRLMNVVAAIAAGDLSKRALAEGGDEVSSLAANINTMADTIEENIKQLKQQDELRRELIANVSHELGGPLSSLRGYLELLNSRDDLPAEQRRAYLQTAGKSAESLAQLSAELLELSKLEAKEISPESEAFSLAEIMSEEILPQHRPAAEAKGMKLSADLPADLPWVHADIALIERVLNNLVGNAVRYGRDEGSIQVTAKAEEDKVLVSVADDGPGISPEDLSRIFDRFYRGRRGETIKGTGLGLAIVKGIIEAHGEEIRAESEPGQGTVFRFTLPQTD